MMIFFQQKGFTLMEVLVATAITGIALGVALSGISMGHRQSLRGSLALEAASLAEFLIMEKKEELKAFSTIAGDIEDNPGWSYQMEFKEISVGGEEVPDLREMTLAITPPGDSRPFVFTTWISLFDVSSTSSMDGARKNSGVPTPPGIPSGRMPGTR